MKPGIKVIIRRQLNELCVKEGLFVGRGDIEPALEWRLYQLQRNRRAESQKTKPSWLYTYSRRPYTKLSQQLRLSTSLHPPQAHQKRAITILLEIHSYDH